MSFAAGLRTYRRGGSKVAIGKKLTGIMKRIEACTTIGQLEELYDQMSEEEKRLAKALHKCMAAIRSHRKRRGDN